jgi:hypothetical protein
MCNSVETCKIPYEMVGGYYNSRNLVGEKYHSIRGVTFFIAFPKMLSVFYCSSGN